MLDIPQNDYEVLSLVNGYIQSIKRLKDQEVFTIGDKTNIGTISGFILIEDKWLVASSKENKCKIGINLLQK